MLEQFQKVLQTPKLAEVNYYKLIQDSMLNTMQSIMPHDFDFGELAKLFDKENESENSASLTYKLTQFFVKVVQQNFISLQSYFALQHQTQKAESTVRGHIKMQQQMKMYLEHLQYKIQRYEYHLGKLRRQHQEHVLSENQMKELKEKETVEQLRRRETQLLKERIVLLRRVDKLERKLKDQENQLQRLNSPTSATILQFKEEFNHRERQAVQDKVSQLQQCSVFHMAENPKPTVYEIDRRISSTQSFTSDHQVTQKRSSNTYNNPAHIYRLYSSSTNKQQFHQQNNQASQQLTQTIKQIQFVQSKNVIIVQNNNNSPIKNLLGIE